MGQVLITGADGYLGTRLADLYLQTTDALLLLWVRASGKGEFEAKQTRLVERFGHFGGRVGCAWGDLASDYPFDDIDPTKVSAIVHTAAVTRFNVDEETARTVNTQGTARVLSFADRCPSLEAIGVLSTVYASGMRPGAIEEGPLDADCGFANHYERSKWESEQLVLSAFAHLPWRIFRVATVVADDEQGRVTQFNALHNTLKLCYYGLLSVVPGDPATPVYLVTADFATRAIFELMRAAPQRSVYHVCHTRDQSLALGELVDLAYGVFNEAEDFRSKRILKPLFCDAESFEVLTDGMGSVSGPVGQALASVLPFARQMFVTKDVRNDHLVSALRDYHAPDPRRLLVGTCRNLVRGRWGREVVDGDR